MKIQSSRFGELEVEQDTLVELSAGMVGFPSDTSFAWIPHPNSADIAWIQSVAHENVAFPLVNAANLALGYPDVPIEKIAEQGGLSFSNPQLLALMAVLSPSPSGPPMVNLMAPVIINAETRRGAQVVLTNSRFTTAELPPPVKRPAASGEVSR